jgi:hypothetical protein
VKRAVSAWECEVWEVGSGGRGRRTRANEASRSESGGRSMGEDAGTGPRRVLKALRAMERECDGYESM